MSQTQTETINDTMNEKMKWYMVRCATTKEEKAIQNLRFELEFNKLEKYVEKIVCPKEKQYFMRNDKKVAREKLMFPGYILMKMDLSNAELPRTIKSTNMVVEIMGDTSGPQPLKEHEVSRIFGNIEKSQESQDFFVGENVEIIDGPFKGFNGTIRELTKDKDRVKVDVMVFGSPTPVELKYLQIDKMK
jgi:transcriptional antiterminator NusG